MQTKSVSKDDMFIKALTETDVVERKKTLNSFVNDQGGYLIPTGFSNEIQRNIFNETGSIRSLATTKFVNEKSMSYPVQTQAPKARWYSEGASTGLTNAKFSNLMIDVRKISAGTDSTWEGLNYQDSYTRQSIITDLKEAIKIRLDYDMLWGNASTGGVGGILTNANLPTGNLVEKITTATSGVADFKDFNRMFGKTKIQFADNMDTIIMHRETFYALMNQTTTTKEPIYKVFEDYQAGALVRRFMNKNVVLVGDYIREKDDLTQEIIGMLDKPNDDGTFAGNSNIAIYGDFKTGYRFHVKKDMFLLEDDSNYPKSLNLAWYLHAFIGGNVIQPQALKVLVAK
jgi:HK97 family phage major capsid protein